MCGVKFTSYVFPSSHMYFCSDWDFTTYKPDRRMGKFEAQEIMAVLAVRGNANNYCVVILFTGPQIKEPVDSVIVIVAEAQGRQVHTALPSNLLYGDVPLQLAVQEHRLSIRDHLQVYVVIKKSDNDSRRNEQDREHVLDVVPESVHLASKSQSNSGWPEDRMCLQLSTMVAFLNVLLRMFTPVPGSSLLRYKAMETRCLISTGFHNFTFHGFLKASYKDLKQILNIIIS